MPTSGQVQARKGGAITLECKASGNPVPSIYWTKKVRTAEYYFEILSYKLTNIYQKAKILKF